MSNYNLDINKYNINELEKLLKLKKNYNLKDLDNAKNKILKNLEKNNSSLDKKNSLELFIDNIYNKLSNKLKEIKNVNNNTLEQFDKHFIIQNQNKGYSILDNNQPIEKSIIKKTYNIDSQFRKNYLETSTNYTLDLPEKIQKVITMSISSINIPLTYYNISDYNKNNVLSLYSINRNFDENDNEKVGEHILDISINNGIYTNENIMNEIQNTIYTTDLSNVLKCGIDKTTGLVYFALSPIVKLKNIVNENNQLNEQITFLNDSSTTSSSIISQSVNSNTVSFSSSLNPDLSYGVLSGRNDENFKIRYSEDFISNSKILKAIYFNDTNVFNDAIINPNFYDDDQKNDKNVIGFYIKTDYSNHSFQRNNCSIKNNNCSSNKEIYDDRRIIPQKQLSYMLGLTADQDLFDDENITKKNYKRISVTKMKEYIYVGTREASVQPPIDLTYEDMKFSLKNNDTTTEEDLIDVHDIRNIELRKGSIGAVDITDELLNNVFNNQGTTNNSKSRLIEAYRKSLTHKYSIPEPYDVYLPIKYGINNENLGSLPCYISYPKYIYIAIDDFQANSKNYFTLATESLLSPNIIARINISSLLEEKKNNNNNSINTGNAIDFLTNQKNIREYFGPTNINKLKISLIDEYGELLNLNDRDWSCLLTFECLYN